MKLGFRERPYDLLLVLLLASVLVPVALLGLQGLGRIALGLVFILFCPGYVLTAALFPKAVDLDWIERLALSFGLSIAVVPLIGLGLNFTPWGIFLEPVVTSLYIFTIGLGTLAYWRRSQLPLDERISLSIEVRLPDWRSYSRTDKVLTAALVASILFAAGTVGYVVVTPRPAEKFTQFFVLNATGVAGGYPTNLTVGQDGTVIVGVINNEYANTSYVVRTYLAVMEEYFNTTANRTEVRELSRSPLDRFSLSIENGQGWNRSYTFRINQPGIFRVVFVLFKLPNDQGAYRTLWLTVRVRTP